jgi:uncharacterized protein YjbJ (UPF0337 family)
MVDTAKQAQGKMTETAHEAQGAMKETAHESMGTARETVTEMADQAQQQASEVMSQVSDQVTTAIGDVREQATSTFTAQRDRAVTSLSALADALREAGRTLDQQRQGVSAQEAPAAAMAPFIDEAADRLAQSADFLKDKDISGLFDEAQRLARKQPGLFMASMFGIGLVGARLLKGAMDDGAEGQQGGAQSSQSGSGFGTGSQTAGQTWGQGSSGSMPSGLGGSSVTSSQSVSHDATTGASANALTGDGPRSDPGPGTTVYAPPDPVRTGYEHASASDTGTGPKSGSGSSNRAQESQTPGAGWVIDDAKQAGDTVDTDARLHDQPGGGAGTTGGSATSGYGTFDPNSLADESRTDAVTGGDASRFVGRKREERS